MVTGGLTSVNPAEVLDPGVDGFVFILLPPVLLFSTALFLVSPMVVPVPCMVVELTVDPVVDGLLFTLLPPVLLLSTALFDPDEDDPVLEVVIPVEVLDPVVDGLLFVLLPPVLLFCTALFDVDDDPLVVPVPSPEEEFPLPADPPEEELDELFVMGTVGSLDGLEGFAEGPPPVLSDMF